VESLQTTRTILTFAAFFYVAGCSNLSEGGDAPNTANAENKVGFFARLQGDPMKSGAVMRRAPMAGGNVVVAGPKGYCIDGKSLTDKISGGFAILASCFSLTKGRVGGYVEPAIMTVTVLPRKLRAEQPDAATLGSGTTQVLERIDGDGISLVHLARGGKALSESSDPKYWRGAMVINGHVVGLAVYAPNGSKLAGPEGRKLAMALAEQLRTVSPYKDYTPQAADTNTASESPLESDNSSRPAAKTGLKRLFPRLFQ